MTTETMQPYAWIENREVAALMTERNRLLAALERLIAADNCNYELATMRHEGLFDEARAALAGKVTR